MRLWFYTADMVIRAVHPPGVAQKRDRPVSAALRLGQSLCCAQFYPAITVTSDILVIGVGFLIALALPAVAAEGEERTTAVHTRVYVGTYTGGASEGIYLLDLDNESGNLRAQGVAAKTENPSFLAVHPQKPVLYAVGEMGATAAHPGGTVTAFRIDPETGLLTLLNQESSMGPGPCHVAVAPSGRHVAVANYTGGSVALLPVLDDGRLGEASAFVQHEGKSVNPRRQEGPHAHAVRFDAAGQFLLTADLGVDKVLVYRYDATQGTLAPNEPAFASLEPGSGPRHVAFHPSGTFVYVVNEMGNTVTAFRYSAETGRLNTLQTIATLPDDFEGDNTTAEIDLHPSGRFLCASNRGHDSIAAFAIDAETGRLKTIGYTLSGGKTPRNFGIDPTGKFLLAANQQSDSIVVFQIDPESGVLRAIGESVEIPTPVCVVFLR